MKSANVTGFEVQTLNAAGGWDLLIHGDLNREVSAYLSAARDAGQVARVWSCRLNKDMTAQFEA